MHYRLLASEDWDRLGELMPVECIPPPAAASAAVAVNADGSLAGVLIGQMVLHTEPLVLANPQVSFKRLFETLMGPLGEYKGLVYYTFSDSPVVEGMAERMGLKPMAYKVWEGRID